MEKKHSKRKKSGQSSRTLMPSSSKKVSLAKHNKMMRLNWLQNRCMCLVCGEAHVRTDRAFTHTLEHYKGGIFFCRLCFQISDSYKKALVHYNSHGAVTPSSYGSAFLCPVCGHVDSCDHRLEILEHFWLHEDDSCRGADNNVFKCQSICSLLRSVFRIEDFEIEDKDCNAKFSDAESLCKHVEQHIKTSKTEKKDFWKSKLHKDRQSTVCKICSDNYFRMDLLFKHVLNHFSAVTFYCRVCFETYKCYELALHHYSSHATNTLPSSGVSMLCHVCGFTENTFECSEIVNHFWQHQNDCCDSAADQAVLKCDSVCNNLSRFLLSEVKFEHGTDMCDAKFTDAESLVRHVKQHMIFTTAVKLEESDKNDSHFASYQKLEEQVLPCEICGDIFFTIDSLFKHVLCHYPGVKFFCWVCFLTFETYHFALVHCKSHEVFSRHQYGVGCICHKCGFTEGTGKSHTIIAHLLQHSEPLYSKSTKKKHYIKIYCKSVTASLRHAFPHNLIFETDTDECEIGFYGAALLCEHVKGHLVKSSIGDTRQPLDDSPSLKKLKLETAMVSTTDTNKYVFDSHFTEINTEKIMKLEPHPDADCSSATHSGASKVTQKQIKTESGEIKTEKATEDCLVDSSLGSYFGTSKVHFAKRKSVPSSTTPNVSPAQLGNETSKVLVAEMTPMSRRQQESDDHSEPLAPKPVVLEVVRQKVCNPSVPKHAGKPKIKIFICRVCNKRFIEEHFFRQHREKAGH